MSQLPIPTHPNLLVGTDSGDDAAIWRISADRALVITTDFITPIVDDAYSWGQIAAANAASDIYAMGGDPILALNLVAWNNDELPSQLLVEVLRGAADKAQEGGWVIAGGHSIEDPEPKYGMCVIGEVHPKRILKNNALKPGDALVLTKPLGTGILTTALKSGLLDQVALQPAVASMKLLNKVAKDVAVQNGSVCATDVTGFGLLGHLKKMLNDTLDASLDLPEIPILEGVFSLAEKGIVPGGSKKNLAWVRDSVVINGQSQTDLTILADAQTSGGLLIALPASNVSEALSHLHRSQITAAVIGTITSGKGKIKLYHHLDQPNQAH